MASLIPYDYCSDSCRAAVPVYCSPSPNSSALPSGVPPVPSEVPTFNPNASSTLTLSATVTYSATITISFNQSNATFAPPTGLPTALPSGLVPENVSLSFSFTLAPPGRRLQSTPSCIPAGAPTLTPPPNDGVCSTIDFTPENLPTNLTTCCGLAPRSKLTCEAAVLSADPRFAKLASCKSGSRPYAITDFPVCPPGFHCPRLNVTNNASWPQICPPSIDCQLRRLGSQWCEQQGDFEPQICPPGSFCPPGGRELLLCPPRHFCVRGAQAPLPCEPLSLCPEGTKMQKYYGGVLFFFIADAAIVALLLLSKFIWEPARIRAARLRRREALIAAAARGGYTSPTPGSGSGTPQKQRALSASFFYSTLEFSPTAVVNPLVDHQQPPQQPLPSPNIRSQKPSKPKPTAQSARFAEDDDPTQKIEMVGMQQQQQQQQHQHQLLGGGASGRFSLSGEDAPPTPLPLSLAERIWVHLTRKRPMIPGGDGAPSSPTGSRASGGDGSGSGSGSAADLEGGSSDASEGTDAACAAAAASMLTTSFRDCNKGLSLTIDFSRLSLYIPAPVNRTILSSVSGSIRAGRVTAVMGPSGAGKTTFLSVLLGRKAVRTGGQLRINGAPGELETFGAVVGFVPQEDVMLEELTVRENILHSARIRLPRAEWDAKRVYRLVDAVVEVLGLQTCVDTLTRSISGGQRKRTNIGMELATAPAAIFLDEPTSGLDSTAALQVCNTLRTIADLGITVVAVIHQPRAEIFQSFDDLLLLAPGGKTVYAGPQSQAQAYFTALGMGHSSSSSSSNGGDSGGGGGCGNTADDILDFIAGEHALAVPLDVLSSVRVGAKESMQQEDVAEAQFRRSSSSSSMDGGTVSPRKWGSVASLTDWGAEWGAGAGNPPSSPFPSPSPPPPPPHASSPTLEAILATAAAAAAAAQEPQQRSVRALQGREVANFLSDAWMCSTLHRSSAAQASAAAVEARAQASGWATSHPRAGMDPTTRAALVDRGAGLPRQFWLCLLRSLLQQSRRPAWLVLEMGVCVFAGTLMGLASTGVEELFTSILAPPMTPLSPAPNVALLPSLGFFVAMAAGIAGSPAAVRTFGEEKDMYLRELSGRHSPLAYFFGKVVGELPRLTLAALHFAGCFMLLCSPASSFGGLYAMVWGLFFGVYGLATLTSMLVDRANGALLGTIAALIMACLSGYGPNLVQGRAWGLIFLQDLAFTRYANEMFLHMETLPFRAVFMAEKVPAGEFGFTLDRPLFDFFAMLLLGVVYRVVAFFCMVAIVGEGGLAALWAQLKPPPLGCPPKV